MSLIIDRRSRATFWATLILFLWGIAWITMSFAVASTLSDTHAPGQDPAITQGDVVKAQWWVIAGLLGLVSLLGQGFLIYVVSGVKENVRKLFVLHECVLTEVRHEKIDHSQLCPVCRSMEVEFKPHGGKS